MRMQLWSQSGKSMSQLGIFFKFSLRRDRSSVIGEAAGQSAWRLHVIPHIRKNTPPRRGIKRYNRRNSIGSPWHAPSSHSSLVSKSISSNVYGWGVRRELLRVVSTPGTRYSKSIATILTHGAERERAIQHLKSSEDLCLYSILLCQINISSKLH